MTKLYRKNETAFAVAWIVIYVAGTGLAETLSAVTGMFKLFPAAFHIALAVYGCAWVKRNGLTEKYGLFPPRYRISRAWFFLPLILIAGYKLYFSPALRFSPSDAALFAASMICVGFLEELIFRGFLFRAMEKENMPRAITVSAVTFGIGHIVNLLGGQSLPETATQIVFAVIVGFALVVLFYRGGSLIPCIVFHGVFNSLSVFFNEEAQFRALGGQAAAAVILIAAGAIVLGAYTLWNWKHLEEAGDRETEQGGHTHGTV